MKTTVTQYEGHILAELDGVVDEDAKTVFDEELHPIIERRRSFLVLDLSGSPRMTSAGIGHLVTLVSRANTKGSRVVLARPTPLVMAIFEATRLTRFFDIAPTIEEAIALLKEGPH